MVAWPLPLWVAHRGAGKLAPENTLAALRLGAAHGYRAFECDVKLSADGVPFLLHDHTLQRTTTGHGVAGDLPWSDLSRLDAGSWHSRAYAGEAMPTLDAVLSFVAANGHALNLEIKPSTGCDHATGVAVAKACRDHVVAQRGQLLLTSFKGDALRGAQETAPDLPRGLLLDQLTDKLTDESTDGWWDTAQRLACVAVVTHHRLMDADLRQRLHGAGLRALCYTVNEAADVERLLSLGIDGLITDAVDHHAPASVLRDGSPETPTQPSSAPVPPSGPAPVPRR
ncbi:MAG: glycerophosphodiester phosphodiesterase [Rubrivivax sp.]